MVSLDKTWCTFYKECLNGRGCERAYLKSIQSKAKKVGCLISFFTPYPKCFMDRKKITSKTKIIQALRMLWLRSKERSWAIKKSGYACKCGSKQSVAKGRVVKLDVHHIDGINVWNKIVELIRKELLVSDDKLLVMCEKCHKKEHKK